MLYTDSNISFFPPDGFCVVKSGRDYWWLRRKKDAITIQLVSLDRINMHKKSWKAAKDRYTSPGYQKIPFVETRSSHGNTIFYNGTIHHTNVLFLNGAIYQEVKKKHPSVYYQSCLEFAHCGLLITIRCDKVCEFAEFLDFIDSISLSKENCETITLDGVSSGTPNLLDSHDSHSEILPTQLTAHIQEQKSVWQQISREVFEGPKFEMPSGFTKDDESVECAIKNKYMTIQLFDVSGLGREGSIDDYLEQLAEGFNDPNSFLLPLDGKRCYVQNMCKEKLMITKCKEISIMIAFEEKCFSLLFNSRKYFNLKKFYRFLNSVDNRR